MERTSYSINWKFTWETITTQLLQTFTEEVSMVISTFRCFFWKDNDYIKTFNRITTANFDGLQIILNKIYYFGGLHSNSLLFSSICFEIKFTCYFCHHHHLSSNFFAWPMPDPGLLISGRSLDTLLLLVSAAYKKLPRPFSLTTGKITNPEKINFTSAFRLIKAEY